MKDLVPVERITSKIYLIRGQKVMLDRDLAQLYGVETKVLKQAVRRHSKRFPEDFMFELSGEEFKNWRSQFVTSKCITPDGHTIVEAAHIKPWALSRDDFPTNGLALCRLCHWSFDEGLMSVGRNYEVLVSRQAKKDPNIPGPIMTFADRPIFRPSEDNYWPSQSNFAWHRESVFK